MLEIVLWTSIVARKYLLMALAGVEDDGVHLMGVVELGTLVLEHNQREEARALVFWSRLHLHLLVGTVLRSNASDGELAEAADRLVLRRLQDPNGILSVSHILVWLGGRCWSPLLGFFFSFLELLCISTSKGEVDVQGNEVGSALKLQIHRAKLTSPVDFPVVSPVEPLLAAASCD